MALCAPFRPSLSGAPLPAAAHAGMETALRLFYWARLSYAVKVGGGAGLLILCVTSCCLLGCQLLAGLLVEGRQR